MSNTSQLQSDAMEVQVLKAVACGFVAFFAIFGNILVISAVWLVPRMKTVTNYLIINMAVSDVLYTVITIPLFYIEIFRLYEWIMSSYVVAVWVCMIANFSQYFLITASVLTLACIAADRLFAIVLPLRNVFTKKVFYMVVPGIWVIAAGVGAPSFQAFKAVYVKGIGFSCHEVWTETATIVYTAVLFSVAYIIPSLCIAIMYTIICRRLWKRKIIRSRHKKQYQKAIESRKKVVKMLITVMVAFTVCWLPLQIATFLWHVGIDISETTNFLCKFLMRVHACTSPFIYAVFSENYRRGFKTALSCCWYKRTSMETGFNKQSLRMTISTRRSSHLNRSVARDTTNGDAKLSLDLLKAEEDKNELSV